MRIAVPRKEEITMTKGRAFITGAGLGMALNQESGHA